MKFKLVSLMFLSGIFVLFGCKKSIRDTDTSTHSSKDNAYAEYQFNKLFLDVNEILNHIKDGHYTAIDPCITLSINQSTSSTLISLDFGADNCLGTDNFERRGRIDINVRGEIGASGSNTTIMPYNYFINDLKIEGTLKLRNIGYDADSNFVHNFDLLGGRIIDFDNNWSLAWDCERIYNEQIESSEQGNLITYTISGYSNGRTKVGNLYSAEITEDLTLDTDCRYIGNGMIDLTPVSLSTRKIYPSETCESEIRVEFNGDTKTVDYLN